MLEELRITGLGVIEEAQLELAAGLTVLTGETGAGKTMVVHGLGLLLGGRADAGLVHAGVGRAVVEGRFRVEPDGPVARRSREAGAELDEDALIAARTVSAEGRSRAHLGGRSVPVSVLVELSEDLVAVHGQSGQLRLLRPARQREALDAFAGAPVAEPLARYRQRYARLREVESLLEDLAGAGRERAREADLLRFGLAEVAAVDPGPDELQALLAEEERLSHADALRTGAGAARDALAGGDDAGAGTPDALSSLAAARRALEPVERHDPVLAEMSRRLAETAYLLADVAADLSSYATSVEVDPARLAAAQDRRAELAGLTRKYGETLPEVLAWAETSAARLAELDGADDRLQRLGTECAELRHELAALAAQVAAARRDAAGDLAAAVTDELASLAMPHARVEVSLHHEPDPAGLVVDGTAVAFGPTGVDEVELLLAPHAGSEARPLGRGASGGELSRVMLAVEVVLAGSQPGPTLVFDEVDAGVGGRAAVEVGARLARLARDSQVLVVTHLPQVAAFADRHLRVVKADEGTVTRSGVVPLDDAGRVRELSRMLAGLEGSATAQAHAEELLRTASMAKAADGVPDRGP